ncbi:MAG: T9SS type A sorting domain-containing protein [Bacteroidia bacterium]
MVRKIIYGLICLPFLVVSFIANAQVAVTTGGPPTNYGTLTAAFTAINNGTHTGTITITLTASHTLTASAILNASGSGSASYTSISISPNTNVTLSCSTTLNSPAIILNGSDNITIDGVNSSGQSLTISHQGINSSSTIRITNSASNITIKNANLYSNVKTTGNIFIDNVSSNNDNILISNNNIGDVSTGQIIAIYAPDDGTGTFDHSNNVTILNNNIFDYFTATNNNSYGIYKGPGQNNWTIQGNKLFQTSTFSIVAFNVSHYGIRILEYAYSKIRIINNTIGYSSAAGTGTYTINSTQVTSFYPIIVTANSTDTASIQGNIISNISFSTRNTGNVFFGIYLVSGNATIGDSIGNRIGSTTSTDNIIITMTGFTGSSTNTHAFGIYSYASNSYAMCKNNSIGGIKFTASTNSYPLAFYGIYLITTAADYISNNTVGSSTVSNSIQLGSSVSTANHLFIGILYNSGFSYTYIKDNIVSNVLCYGAGTTDGYSYMGAIRVIGNQSEIKNNTIKNLTTYSGATNTAYYQTLIGIFNYTTSGTTTNIDQNTITNLKNQNSTSANIMVSGITHYAGSGLTVSMNKLSDIGISGSASGTISNGIYIYLGTANIINNFIHYNNNLTQNIRGVIITGGSNHTCNYNTILIEGTNTLTGVSACFMRSNVTMSVQNNIFFNKRSSSGTNYSLYNNTSIFTGATIGYNLHVVPNTSTAIYHNSAARTWANYYSVQNSSDRFSWCESTTNLAATSLFTNTTTSDLTINSANSACWYVNGKGWPISGLDYDWENLSGDRSAAITDGGTDIGADEFNTSTTPPTATASAAPAAGTTTTYTFAGKTVASIAWTGGSNVPASVSVWYYSGNNPPVPIPGKNAFNCYWRIEPSTTPSGMSYRPTLYFSDALLGAVPSTTDLRMAKNSGLTPSINNWSCACSGTTVNATTRTFVPTTPYTSFSIFTGTDINAPLPVELLSFTATKQDKDILLQWQTASEKNSERFDIERSYNGVDFEYTGKSVSAADMSNTLRSYNSIDGEYAHTATVVYYRLKIVDRNGYFEYSTVAVVTINATKQTSAIVHPNPFSNTTTLTLQNAKSGRIEIIIMDLAGNQLYSQNYDVINAEEDIKIDTEFLKSGTYVLRVVTAKESVTRKLIRY